MKRRDFMIGTGAAGLVLASQPRTKAAVPTMLVPSAVKPLVISSANGNSFKNGGEVDLRAEMTVDRRLFRARDYFRANRLIDRVRSQTSSFRHCIARLKFQI